MSKKWNMDVMFPNGSEYILRCIEESFGQSTKGNLMITYKFEVVAPEEVEVGGELYNVAGTPIKFFVVTQNGIGDAFDAEKSKDSESRLMQLYKDCEMPHENLNVQNPPLGLKGKLVYAHLENKQDVKRKSPTAEQIKAGKREGDVMVNPKTKEPLKTNYPEIKRIFGLAPDNSGSKAF